MEKAAKEMDFMEAARLRDELFSLEKLLEEKFPRISMNERGSK
jgi:excinuclease ABC subunit B